MSNRSEEETQPSEPGHLQHLGMLDLRSAQTPEDLQHITRISHVGCILISEHLMAALSRIPMSHVGGTIGVPAGQNIKMQSGQLQLSGESFTLGSPDEILLIMGQAFINSPVTSVGFKEIWLYGQAFAIRGSEATLGAKLGRVNGQIFYLPAEARVVMGETTIDQEFLEYLPAPRALVIMGSVRFTEDVTKEMLRSKIEEIVLMGVIVAPASLLSLIRVLTKEQMGEILSIEQERQRQEAKDHESDDDTDVQ